MLPIDLPPPPPATPSLALVDTVFTAERVPSASPSRMGLVGLHHLHQVTPNWWVGPAVFAPVSGERGGFFGWGLSNLLRWESGAWGAEAALFAGGGGGGPSWVGGGLMWRSHLAATHVVGPVRLGLGVSQLRFPNGGVGGSQPFASLAWTGLRFHGAPGGRGAVPAEPGFARATETSAFVVRYTMHRGSVRRDGAGSGPPLHVAGLSFRRDLSGDDAPGGRAGDRPGGWRPYVLLSAGGSLSSPYPGHAEVYGGLGLRWSPPGWSALALRGEAAIGSGGGGAALDTGGGLLGKLSAGLSWQPLPSVGVNLLAGVADSPGRFRAREARVELAWRGWDWLPVPTAAGARSGAEARSFDTLLSTRWAPWTAGIGWAHHPRMRRDDGREAALGVAVLSAERELDPAWRLVAHADIATHGNAGGYATGRLGLAWLAEPLAAAPCRLGVEATLGAAGGGGVQVAGGLIAQGQLIGRCALSPAWALQLDAGWLRSRRSALSSPVLGLSLVHAFSRLEGR